MDTQNSPQSVTLQPRSASVFKFVLLVLLLIISFAVGWFAKGFSSVNVGFSESPIPTVLPDQITITGVIRTSGLSEDEKQRLTLTTVDYQVTDFAGKPSDQIWGYYLLPGPVTEELLGKCVRISGKIPEEWKSKDMSQDLYSRSVLAVASIEKIADSICSPYPGVTFDSSQEQLTLHGIVGRTPRPAPDIGYDYTLRLSTPFFDELSPSGSAQEVKLLAIYPTSNEIWTTLENNMDNSVSITGYLVWGYAESRFFQLTSVSPAN